LECLANGTKDTETLLTLSFIFKDLRKHEDAKDFYYQAIEIKPQVNVTRQRFDKLIKDDLEKLHSTNI
jgi:hypothetical protein